MLSNKQLIEKHWFNKQRVQTFFPLKWIIAEFQHVWSFAMSSIRLVTHGYSWKEWATSVEKWNETFSNDERFVLSEIAWGAFHFTKNSHGNFWKFPGWMEQNFLMIAQEWKMISHTFVHFCLEFLNDKVYIAKKQTEQWYIGINCDFVKTTTVGTLYKPQ